MASLADIAYQPTGKPTGFTLAGLNLERSQALEDAGLTQSRILRNFSEYDLPDLANGQAARGAFFSSATTNKADRLRQGATDDVGDSSRILSRTLANLAAQGVMASTGIQL